MWVQKKLVLKPRERGFHLITTEINAYLNELSQIDTGILFLFLQHSSASLCINENADPTVRVDMNHFFNRLVPESSTDYLHRDEGRDDMPAHLKTVILGSTLTIPIDAGRMALGTWQGIYLCEHRNHGGARHLLMTVNGSTLNPHVP